MSCGPLADLKAIEFAELAPAPFAWMLLADLGADVVRVDRAVGGPDGALPAPPPGPTDILNGPPISSPRMPAWRPLLSLNEALLTLTTGPEPPFVDVGGVTLKAPRPRFSRSPAPTPAPPPAHGGGWTSALEASAIPSVVLDLAVNNRAPVIPSPA